MGEGRERGGLEEGCAACARNGEQQPFGPRSPAQALTLPIFFCSIKACARSGDQQPLSNPAGTCAKLARAELAPLRKLQKHTVGRGAPRAPEAPHPTYTIESVIQHFHLSACIPCDSSDSISSMGLPLRAFLRPPHSELWSQHGKDENHTGSHEHDPAGKGEINT